jgi:hypothetical protein
MPTTRDLQGPGIVCGSGGVIQGKDENERKGSDNLALWEQSSIAHSLAEDCVIQHSSVGLY